jgi:hypothetical protein
METLMRDPSTEYCSQGAESFYQSETQDLNILNLTCKIRTRKRSRYYIHDYNPSAIRTALEKSYTEENIYMFDFQLRSKCCYCIAITVYFTKVDKEYFERETMKDIVEDKNKYEYRYLLSILQTVNNAKMFLPDWVVRIYMDKSIYQTLRDKKNKTLCSIFDEIFESDNVEVYTYDCNVKNVEQTRTYRFLPMIDETVAKVAIREADGCLCKMDCNNIRVFSQRDAIMYLAQYFPNTISELDDENDMIYPPKYDTLNSWIGIYKEFNLDYFDSMTNLYSLVAGSITLNLMVKSDLFSSTFSRVQNLIADIKSSGEIDSDLYESLDIGFDEIFLLDLFRDFICINRNFDEREYFMLNRFVIGSLNYPTYKVAGNNIAKIVPNLQELVIQGLLEYVPEIDPNENDLDFLKIVDSAVSFQKGIIFNVKLKDLEIVNPFGSTLPATLLSLLNIQYVYVENKINCVALSKDLNYRKKNSPKDKCWIGNMVMMLEDLSLFDRVYIEEKRHLDEYYRIQTKKKEKRKRSNES